MLIVMPVASGPFQKLLKKKKGQLKASIFQVKGGFARTLNVKKAKCMKLNQSSDGKNFKFVFFDTHKFKDFKILYQKCTNQDGNRLCNILCVQLLRHIALNHVLFTPP